MRVRILKLKQKGSLSKEETATLSSLQKQLQELAVYKPSGDAPERSSERSSTAPADLKLSMFDKLFGTETAEQKQLKELSQSESVRARKNWRRGFNVIVAFNLHKKQSDQVGRDGSYEPSTLRSLIFALRSKKVLSLEEKSRLDDLVRRLAEMEANGGANGSASGSGPTSRSSSRRGSK